MMLFLTSATCSILPGLRIINVLQRLRNTVQEQGKTFDYWQDHFPVVHDLSVEGK